MWDPVLNLIIGVGLNLLFGIGDFVSDEVTAYREAELLRPCASGQYRSGEPNRCVRLAAAPPSIVTAPPITTHAPDCRTIDPATYEVRGECRVGSEKRAR